jgi:uncharacterized protein YceK
MAFRAIRVALLLSSLPMAGCGTVANLTSPHAEEGEFRPFGGVRQDVWCMKQAANGEFGFRAHPKSDAEQYPRTALVLFCAADLPFSLVGDIVVWPFAVYNFINQPVPAPPVAITASAVQPIQTPPPKPASPTLPAPQPLPTPLPPPKLPMPSAVPPAALPSTTPPATLPIPMPPATPVSTDDPPKDSP